ncbi:hypothetical protein B0T24DRAFT_604200 [Lasiosphaeria ovina]|uniref:Uncharacterized protein n=1 Tax=Lasiosphaeria ovina TaxID=92902 RepID=A0AAE0NKQ0_9PEZI|nr:hypothetical protein B0T24DRAFT_604200 [Lasiosphaeria ovina]
MQLKSLFVILATGLMSMVAADALGDETTTSTSTMTKTVTITSCNPTVTDCPARTSTSVPVYPLSNSTSSAGPTAYSNSTSSFVIYTSSPAPTGTPGGSSTPTKSTTATSSLATGGAGSLFVQSGLLLSVLGAGVALLA